MRGLSPIRFLKMLCLVTLLGVLALCLLPHDPYIRFQQLASESVHYLRVKWIYERVHFDQTPIDVAFIGTSHTQSGIDSEHVEAVLRARGVDQHVVNFAVPHLGRDLEYLVARELLEHRQIRTLVIEVQQSEARAPHPGFQRLATAGDMLQAPLLINTGVVDNFVRLPLRQLDLSLRTAFPAWFGLQGQFDVKQYEGPHWNDTYRLHGFAKARTTVYTRAEFEPELAVLRKAQAQRAALARKLDLPFMEFNLTSRYNDLYLQEMVELAKRHSVQVVFLYLPFLDEPGLPQHRAWLERQAKIMVPTEIIHDSSIWQNADHLNYSGAQKLSAWVADQLAAVSH